MADAGMTIGNRNTIMISGVLFLVFANRIRYCPTGLAMASRTVERYNFSPLGAPASNLHGPELYAAFPHTRRVMPDWRGTFPSHAPLHGTDNIGFTFVPMS